MVEMIPLDFSQQHLLGDLEGRCITLTVIDSNLEQYFLQTCTKIRLCDTYPSAHSVSSGNRRQRVPTVTVSFKCPWASLITLVGWVCHGFFPKVKPRAREALLNTGRARQGYLGYCSKGLNSRGTNEPQMAHLYMWSLLSASFPPPQKKRKGRRRKQ